MPALDFNILHSNQEQEMNQEDQPLDEDQQELQDLVDATEGLAVLDQDRHGLADVGIGNAEDQNAPPP